MPLKPSIVYWLCCALSKGRLVKIFKSKNLQKKIFKNEIKSRDHSNLSAQCKGLVLTGDQSKRLTPYLENGLKFF